MLTGAAAATLTAVAANKDWAAADGSRDDVQFASAVTAAGEAQMPLAGALALVLLAAWGVLLVTRGTARRLVAVLGLLAALGVLATVAVGYRSTQDSLREAFAEVGASGVAVETTGWFWAAAVGALLSVPACVAAVRFAPGWPAMGTRYDAPGGRAQDPGRGEDAGSRDLWRSIDEGHDPTA